MSSTNIVLSRQSLRAELLSQLKCHDTPFFSDHVCESMVDRLLPTLIEQQQFLASFVYSPVVDLPTGYEVYDFSKNYDPNRARSSEFGVGRYHERRPGMYATELFVEAESSSSLGDTEASAKSHLNLFHPAVRVRDIHVGVDIAAPVGTPVKAFFDGSIYLAGINPAAGDYGGTVLTEHRLGDRSIWALYGHLSHSSVRLRQPGEKFSKGDVLGWIGSREENGGWNPHLHFQLSWRRPLVCDLPGVVNENDLEDALRAYPDPRWVLGRLY